MHVVATAGHVDHGKSTLVHALTGTDPDRWAEEKARGLTIDLGFAATTLPSGAEIGFIDVPGHVRFLKNMLAGVGGVDACLFVVAATEVWKPQSEEHLRILELLGISHGVIALTKVGLVDDEWRELALMEVADHVAGTFLQDADIVAVDTPTGQGLDGLRDALDRLLAATPTAVDRGWPRLWIDRSFAARGSGTVVTGTLTGGSLSVDDELDVEPGGWRGRVRALQSHGRSLPHASPGRRLAVNLAGVAHDRVARGQALVRPRQWHRTAMVDASLTVLDSLDHEVTRRGAYVAYFGSGEHAVLMRVLGRPAPDRTTVTMGAGATGLVRLWLPVALPLLPGDRYVLRDAGRAETVGGGEVLDVAPVLPASRATPSRSVDRVVAERGWVDVGELERLIGEEVVPTLGSWVVDAAALKRTSEELREAVARAGANGLDIATLDDRRRAVLATLGDLEVSGGRVRPVGAAGVGPDTLANHAYLLALQAAPYAPPDSAGVDRVELRELARRGLVVDVGAGMWFAASAVESAAREVARLLMTRPEGVTVSEVREALGNTRKHAVPLLAHLDATGVTRRRGDVRIGGPRLPAP